MPQIRKKSRFSANSWASLVIKWGYSSMQVSATIFSIFEIHFMPTQKYELRFNLASFDCLITCMLAYIMVCLIGKSLLLLNLRDDLLQYFSVPNKNNIPWHVINNATMCVIRVKPLEPNNGPSRYPTT